MATSLHSFFFISSILFTALHVSQTQAKPSPVKGLSYSFYSKTCPKLETIVRNHLKKVFKNDNGQAPALLRIFFHDCFVQVINCNNPINCHKNAISYIQFHSIFVRIVSDVRHALILVKKGSNNTQKRAP